MQEPSLRAAHLLRLPTRATTCLTIWQLITPYPLQLPEFTLTTPTNQFPLHPIQASSLHLQLACSLTTTPSHNLPLLTFSLVPLCPLPTTMLTPHLSLLIARLASRPTCPLLLTMGFHRSKRLINSHPAVPFYPLGIRKLSVTSLEPQMPTALAHQPTR